MEGGTLTGTHHVFVSRSHITFLRPLSPGSMPSLRMALLNETSGQPYCSLFIFPTDNE
jgi:hypothetical protein